MEKISSEIKEQVLNLRKLGKSYKQILELFPMSKSTLSNICKEYNLTQANKVELTEELKETILNRYNELGSIKKVAKEFHISYDRLKLFLVLKNTISVNRNSRAERRKQNKSKLLEIAGGKCQICGYNRCNEALDFHHLDPNEKDFNISDGTRSFEKQYEEIKKCILVCANCHREIHSGFIKI